MSPTNTKSSSLNLRKVLLFCIVINFVYLLAETVFGFCIHSMGLVADAAHNLCDVAGMMLVLTAFRLTEPVPTHRFTYGYKKASILLVVVVAFVLSVLGVFIILGGIHQIQMPRLLNGTVIALMAAGGVLVNGITAFFIMQNKKRTSKAHNAFRNILVDALVSLVVMIEGVAIHFLGWFNLDAIIGFVIVGIILLSLFDLTRSAIRFVLDGVPAGINYEQVVRTIYTVENVVDVHHLHIWSTAPKTNVLAAHVVVKNMDEANQVKDQLGKLLESEGISNLTLEFEVDKTKEEKPTE